MKSKSNSTLISHVRISPHFQRSARLDADLGRSDALNGYIYHQTAANVLDSITRQINRSNQRAFTLTGPYGSGKSSFAVAFSSALSQDKDLRIKARKSLNLENSSEFNKAFPVNKGWLILPIVGKRGSVSQEIAKTLEKVSGRKKLNKGESGASVISNLCALSQDANFDGVLVVIDEMGKFLEASALGSGDDVYFFQELAEAAARAPGKFVIIGILHQSFRQYAARLGSETRDDWAKIQGRFSDIPIVTGTDEIVELVSQAIVTDIHLPETITAAEVIAESMRKRRPIIGVGFAKTLAACWPLHPVVAALIGSVSKRQFGQNERSAFGFLSSAEPYGFQDFLHANSLSGPSWYRPDNYWDYLRVNLEPAILSSSDGHRWAQAVEAIERAESKGADLFDLSVIKSLAVIDLFRNGSGIPAEETVLLSVFGHSKENAFKASLKKLEKWRVIIFKKHIGAWSVFEGSDFDIDGAISEEFSSNPGVDFEALIRMANLNPALAKRHYHKTGTFRWMEVALCRLEDVERYVADYSPVRGEFGLFLLALPNSQDNFQAASKKCSQAARIEPWPIIIGVPEKYSRINDLALELFSLQRVENRPELQGDSVARREIKARIDVAKSNLEDYLKSAIVSAVWHFGGSEIQSGINLSPLASKLADKVFCKAPKVWSELVNRDTLSPNSVKARRDLLQRMLSSEMKENLGIDGFPAERGLYETLLKKTGLHGVNPESNEWGFLAPKSGVGDTFIDLWGATLDIFDGPEKKVRVQEIYSLWSQPPFGLRKGLHSVLITVFLLANKANIALYKDGLFLPVMTDVDMDEFLQDESRYAFRWITIDSDKARILSGISDILADIGRSGISSDPLEAARSLVSMVLSLPGWSQRTHQLSPNAKLIRDMLLRADDPHKVLFVDLPSILETDDGNRFIDALRSPLLELSHSYKTMITKVLESLIEALDASLENLEDLRSRAKSLSHATGDLRQDAFVAYLSSFDGSRASVESILSLSVNKPPRDWNDRDIDAALIELAKFALRFRHTEALVGIRGRKPHSDAFAVIIGAGSETRTISREFALPSHHRSTVESLANKLVVELKSKGLRTELLLAVLAHAGLRLATTDEKEFVND